MTATSLAPKARWFVGRRFSEVEAAHSWGIPIHVWDTYPEAARAEMMAFSETKAAMGSYEQHLQDKDRNADRLRREAAGLIKG